MILANYTTRAMDTDNGIMWYGIATKMFIIYMIVMGKLSDMGIPNHGIYLTENLKKNMDYLLISELSNNWNGA